MATLLEVVQNYTNKIWKPISKVTEAMATEIDSQLSSITVDLETKAVTQTVESKDDDFTAVGDYSYIITVASKTATLPTTEGGDIFITNSSVGDATIGALGTLGTLETCRLYWNGTAYAEFTAVLT